MNADTDLAGDIQSFLHAVHEQRLAHPGPMAPPIHGQPREMHDGDRIARQPLALLRGQIGTRHVTGTQ